MSTDEKWHVAEKQEYVTYDIPTAKFFANLMDSYFITNNYD